MNLPEYFFHAFCIGIHGKSRHITLGPQRHDVNSEWCGKGSITKANHEGHGSGTYDRAFRYSVIVPPSSWKSSWGNHAFEPSGLAEERTREAPRTREAQRIKQAQRIREAQRTREAHRTTFSSDDYRFI